MGFSVCLLCRRLASWLLQHNRRESRTSFHRQGYRSKPEAANYLGLSVRTLERLLPNIPHYKVGRRILFRIPEIDTWMEQYRRTPSDINLRQLAEEAANKLLHKEGD